MRIPTTLALAFCATLLATIAPVDAQRERPSDRDVRPVKYSFPTALPGVDFGRARLIALAKEDRLDAEMMVDRLTGDLRLSGVARLVRIMGPDELAALNREVKDGNLLGLVRQATSARHLTELLDKAGVREGDLTRGMRKVFRDFYTEEFAAYWVQRGLSEGFLAGRLASSPERTHTDRLQKFDDLWRREADRPDRIWDDFKPGDFGITGDDMEARVALWLGLPGRPDRPELEFIFREERLILTPEIQRVLAFGDPALSASVLQAAGLKPAAFRERVRDRLRDLRDGDKRRHGEAMLSRLENTLTLADDWLYGAGVKISGVYVGSHSVGQTPILGALEGDGKAAGELPDRGISETLLAYFRRSSDFRVVMFEGGLVRAQVGSLRLEGKVAADTGRIELIAPYGGAERKYASHKFHGGGLLLELEQEISTDKRQGVLLRRINPW